MSEEMVDAAGIGAGQGIGNTTSTPDGSQDVAEQDSGWLLSESQEQKVADIPESADGYKFTFQPDIELDHELLNEFKALAHKKGMSQTEAQEYAKFYEQAVRKNVAEMQSALIQQEFDFRQQCQADREIGGARFEENVAYATRAIEKFSTPGLLEVLSSTGFGSHPEVVRFCARIGRALAEKPMAQGEERPRAGSLAELMYPSMSNQ